MLSRCTSWSTVSDFARRPLPGPEAPGEGGRRGARAPASRRWSAWPSGTLAGRLIRVLAELELVSLDRDLPALAIAGGAQTALERSPAYRGLRKRYEDGRRFLSSANPGQAAEPLRAEPSRALPGRRASPAPDRAATDGAARDRRYASRSSRDPSTATHGDRAHRADARPSGGCSATCSRSSRSTPTRRVPIDRDRVEEAFVYACVHHADQRRKSGEDFIIHPVGVAKICAGMRLDTETLCAALLHDTVEDTTASLEEVQEAFGEEIAGLVDGVTKLTGLTFQSRDEAQAENYRKMMVAMATDIRVILIKLADRLHNMRTIGAMPKQKQIEKARETLDIYAPIAHRLGIHAIKWELEDLAFQTLHPRKYNEIKGLVAQQRAERERYVNQAGRVPRQGARRARDRGRDLRPRQALLLDLLEDDQEGPRVQRDLRPHGDARDRRLGEGLLRRRRRDPLAVEAAARALQGLHRDAQVQHVPVAAHDGDRARGPAARDPDPHPRDARPRRVRDRRALDVQGGRHAPTATRRALQDPESKLKWLRSLLDWQQDLSDPREFMETLKVDLFEDEVFVFTPKGEVKSLAAGATPLDFAYEIHTDVGHRCVGAKVNGKIVPLSYQLRSGDIVEVLTSKRERGPSRDWLALVQDHPRAQQDQGVVQGRVAQGHRAHRPRAAPGAPKQAGPAGAEARRLAAARRRDPRDGLPQGRGLLHRARRRQDLAEGRRQQGHAAAQAGRGRRVRADRGRRPAPDAPAPLAPDDLLVALRDRASRASTR